MLSVTCGSSFSPCSLSVTCAFCDLWLLLLSFSLLAFLALVALRALEAYAVVRALEAYAVSLPLPPALYLLSVL